MRRYLCVLSAVLKDFKPVHIMESNDSSKLLSNFRDWKFKNPPSYSELPISDNPEYNVPVAVNNFIFSKVPTEGLTGNIKLVCSSEKALKEILDLDPAVADTEEFIDCVAGKYLPEGGLSVSHRYGGYQFGFWADQLGDGRAHTLGEYVNSKSELWQIQLKGSGETPYSRFGDGRAVLRSSIREMIASESCYALGIPTTRAGALVVSDSHKVWRDKSYSGAAKQEPAAVVMRLAPCWYRIGSLEILLKRKEYGLLKTFTDFVVANHFKEIDPSDKEKYVKFFEQVAYRNLDMVASWQGIGFTHGVLNTDNVSLLGLTIDYGPYGFIDHFSEFYVPNSSDDMGRYAFNRQAGIMLWNLGKLAEALSPILTEEDKEKIENIRDKLQDYVQLKIVQTYLKKLGIETLQEGDGELVYDLLQLMQDCLADFTMTFRQLGEVEINELSNRSALEDKWSLLKLYERTEKWTKWLNKYKQRLDKDNVTDSARRSVMMSVNPIYVPRNWMMQEAIAEAEKGDFEKVRFLLQILQSPYSLNEQAETYGYSSQPPSWAYGLKLSCSS